MLLYGDFSWHFVPSELNNNLFPPWKGSHGLPGFGPSHAHGVGPADPLDLGNLTAQHIKATVALK